MNIDNAVILEGGGMRGIFTSGVLDVLMENEIYFNYTIGVSAGALNGLNYLSRQPGRSAKVSMDYINDPRYVSVKNMFKEKRMFSFDFLMGEVAKNLVPFDFYTFDLNPQQLIVVTTNLKTGCAEYFDKFRSCFFDAVVASASLPMLSKKVRIGEHYHLDGGCADSIPLEKTIEDGYPHPVLILTQHKEYRKPAVTDMELKIYRKTFRSYPKFVEALVNRPQKYNVLLDRIEKLEEKGEIFVIRPEEPIVLGRVERNVEKLEAVYQRGRAQARQLLPQLLNFLEKQQQNQFEMTAKKPSE